MDDAHDVGTAPANHSNTRVRMLGYVSAQKREEVQAPSDLAAAGPAAMTDANFGYQGGSIISNPEVHTSFWGASWDDVNHTQRRDDLIQFAQDLLASDYMNILSQYGVGQGAGRCGSYAGSSNLSTATGQMSDADIHSSIQSMIDAGTLPEPGTPSGVALLIFLDESIEINDPPMSIVMCEPNGDTAFGYHYFFTTRAGHQFYYSVIPALDDACLTNSCAHDNTCSLHLAETQEQRQTQVASHEFCEMVTDPEISGWRDPGSGEENGDICNGQTGAITVSGRTWTVQLMYSRVDDISGAQACLLSAPQPIPSLLGPYQTRVLEVATTFFNETDGTWFMADWDRDGIPDLIFIKTNNTPNGHVEVHVASGKSKR